MQSMLSQPTVATTRRAILGQAQARVHDVTEVVLAAIFESMPEYARGRSEAELDDIRSGISRSVQLCLATVAEGRGIEADERMALRLTGGQRARLGIPRALVLDSVKVATRAGLSFLMTCGDPATEPVTLTTALRQIAEHISRFEDEACHALADGHDEASRQVFSGGDRGEAVLVDRLLEQRFRDEDEVLGHAAEFGLSRARPAHVVVAVSSAEADAGRLRAVAGELRPHAMLAVGAVRSTVQVHLPLLVQPRGPQEWHDFVTSLDEIGHRHRVTVLYAERAGRLTGVSSVYRSLRDSLPFIAAATTRPGAVRSLVAEFHRVMCVGGVADRLRLMDDVLAPLHALPPRDRDELLETVDSVYETGGSSASLAKHLHLHKNTISNRLRRVGEVTGLDLRCPSERLVLDSLLRMRLVAEAASLHMRPGAVNEGRLG